MRKTYKKRDNKNKPWESKLATKKPDTWLRLIKSKLKNENDQMRYWMASIILFSYPRNQNAFNTNLDIYAMFYRADLNRNTSVELRRSFETLGLTYVYSKADDAIPSDDKKGSDRGLANTKKRRSSAGIKKAITWHQDGKTRMDNGTI